MGAMKMRPLIPDQFRRCPDISKAKKQLGFEPRSDGNRTKDTVEWYDQYLEAGNKVYE